MKNVPANAGTFFISQSCIYTELLPVTRPSCPFPSPLNSGTISTLSREHPQLALDFQPVHKWHSFSFKKGKIN